MRAWLRPILKPLLIGLVPIDGDFGRRESPPQEDEPCLGVDAIHAKPRRPRTDETAWIPRALLYGPPF